MRGCSVRLFIIACTDFLFGLIVCGSQVQAATEPTEPTEARLADLRTFHSPYIKGEVLIIHGRIDRGIYDFLAYPEALKAMQSVRVLELDSLGGDNDWGLEIARRLRPYKLITRLSAGHYCASACVYLFAAGEHREADDGVWLGVHGARLGAGYTTTFAGLCMVDLEVGVEFAPRKKGCQAFLDRWRELSVAATNEAFDFFEAGGVSPAMRTDYFGMPDDLNWAQDLNVVRKPNWPVDATTALRYGLVTKITGTESRNF